MSRIGTSDGGTLTKQEAHALRLAELAAMAITLESYADADWDHGTYCDGWRVRDVVGHMLTGYTTPLLPMVRAVAAKGFNVDRASAVKSAEYGSAHTPAELLGELRRVQRDDVRLGIAKLIPPSEGVVDHVIHHLDITRPLGRSTTTTDAARRASLDRIVTLGGFVRAKPRAKGLRFEATDQEWSWGSGPEVRGPSEDLLLALSGRPAGLAALSGDGLPTLRARLA